jgi:hypothetical protein
MDRESAERWNAMKRSIRYFPIGHPAFGLVTETVTTFVSNLVSSGAQRIFGLWTK